MSASSFPTLAATASELVAEGNELYQKGDMEGALKKYLEAQTLKPNAPELHFNIGDVHFGKGKFDDAATEFRRIAPAADRKLLPALAYNLATSLVKQKRPERAIDLYKAAIKLDPTDLEARYNLGVLLDQQKQQQQKKSEQQQDQKDRKDKQGQKSEQQQDARKQQSEQQKQQQGQKAEQPKSPDEKKKQQAAKPQENKDRKDKDKKASAAGEEKDGEKPPQQIQGAIPREQAERLLDLLKDEEKRGIFLVQPKPAVPEPDPEKDW